MIVQHYYFSIARIAKQYSIHTANSIWCTAHALSEFARAKKQQQSKPARKVDSVLPCGGCEPLWVCACLCGPPLRYTTPPSRSRGRCLARVVVAAKQITLVHCHSTRAPSRVYIRTLVSNHSLARSNLSQVQGRERTHKTHKKVNIKGICSESINIIYHSNRPIQVQFPSRQ